MAIKEAKRKSAKRIVRRQRIRVGDRVTFMIGPQRWRALVIEDRGRFGGTRILRIRTLSRSPGAESSFEIPENEVSLIGSSSRKNGKL